MRKMYLIILAVLLTLGLIQVISGCTRLSKTIISNNTPQQSESPEWKEIKKGLNYAEITTPTSDRKIKNLIVVKIDPRQFDFSIYQNKNQDNAKSIKEISQETKADLTFNGGFFTEDFKPTGLLISKGEKFRNQSPAELLNGTFAIDINKKPELIPRQANFDEKKYPFAIQNGPILIDPEGKIKITKDTGKTASRTAIGLDKENNIIVILIRQTLFNSENIVSLFELAHLLKEAPALKDLQLHSFLNLDGGPSSGMIVGQEYFPELEKVQNVVIVKKI